MTFPLSLQETRTHYLLSISNTQASPVPLALQGTYSSPTVSPKPVILSTALQTLLFLSQTLNPDFLFFPQPTAQHMLFLPGLSPKF